MQIAAVMAARFNANAPNGESSKVVTPVSVIRREIGIS